MAWAGNPTHIAVSSADARSLNRRTRDAPWMSNLVFLLTGCVMSLSRCTRWLVLLYCGLEPVLLQHPYSPARQAHPPIPARAACVVTSSQSTPHSQAIMKVNSRCDSSRRLQHRQIILLIHRKLVHNKQVIICQFHLVQAAAIICRHRYLRAWVQIGP